MSSGYVFGRGSNVLEHWLLHAEGFVVRSRGARVGTVRDVVVDPVHGRATALVLRSPFLRRRRVVPAAAVQTVDPEARLFEAHGREEQRHRRSHLDTLRRVSDALDRGADAAEAWVRPRLRALALTTARIVRRCMDRLANHLHDRYARPGARPGVRGRARGGPRRRAATARPSRRGS